MLCGIAHINTATDNGNGATACRKCTCKRNSVDTGRHTGNHDGTRRGEIVRNGECAPPSVRGELSRAYGGNEKLFVKIGELSTVIKKHGRSRYLAQGVRISLGGISEQTHAMPFAKGVYLLGALGALVEQSRSVGGIVAYGARNFLIVGVVHSLRTVEAREQL